MKRIVMVVLLVAFFISIAPPGFTESKKSLPKEKSFGKIEAVAFFTGPMPTGVTVSSSGRMFVNFPQWGDKVTATVAEIRKGKTVPYPNEKINQCEKGNQQDCFVAVQSVVVDPKDRLLVIDTGSIGFGTTRKSVV